MLRYARGLVIAGALLLAGAGGAGIAQTVSADELDGFTPFCTARDIAPAVNTVVANPAPNASGWNHTNVTLMFTATDPAPSCGMASIRVYDNGVRIPCDIPNHLAKVSCSIVLSAEGVHTIAYHSHDMLGHQEAPQTIVVRIDKSAPSVVFPRIHRTFTVDQSVVMTCTATDGGSGIPSGTRCASTPVPAYQLGAGAQRVSASVTDRAGNTGRGSAPVTIVVTPQSLCNVTRQLVTDTAIAGRLCALLLPPAGPSGSGTGIPSPEQIAAYQNVLATEDTGLTREQAVQLSALAAAL